MAHSIGISTIFMNFVFSSIWVKIKNKEKNFENKFSVGMYAFGLKILMNQLLNCAIVLSQSNVQHGVRPIQR